MTRCGTCGSHVTVISDAEGTSHYEPLETELLAILRDLRGSGRRCGGSDTWCMTHNWMRASCPQGRLRDLLAWVDGAGE